MSPSALATTIEPVIVPSTSDGAINRQSMGDEIVDAHLEECLHFDGNLTGKGSWVSAPRTAHGQMRSSECSVPRNAFVQTLIGSCSASKPRSMISTTSSRATLNRSRGGERLLSRKVIMHARAFDPDVRRDLSKAEPVEPAQSHAPFRRVHDGDRIVVHRLLRGYLAIDRVNVARTQQLSIYLSVETGLWFSHGPIWTIDDLKSAGNMGRYNNEPKVPWQIGPLRLSSERATLLGPTGLGGK